ncbi:MAG: MMPL family transporter [Microthrixaceae bacterium]
MESRSGFEVLEDRFAASAPERPAASSSRAKRASTTPRSEIDAFLGEVEGVQDAMVTSPFGPPAQDPEQALAALGQFLGDELDPTLLAGPERISTDGTIAYADVELPGSLDQEAADEFTRTVEELQPSIEGVRVEYGGQLFAGFEPPSSELLGLAFAIVILILATGSVLAMGLPIGNSLGGIGVGATVILLLSNVVSMPDFAATLGIMIGLGVGIDYALS